MNMLESVVSVEPLGDSAMIVRWTPISDHIVEQIRIALEALNRALPADQFAMVPAFETLTVHFDNTQMCIAEATARVWSAMAASSAGLKLSPRLIEIPVCYHPHLAPDIEHVAEHCGLSIPEVIRLHSDASYTVRMIGFSPGFPYLSGLPAAIQCPRRATPRLSVPPGSVAIGGTQTGIYPQATPGGWNVIGRTPVRLFDPTRPAPCLLAAGDHVRFVPIDHEAFDQFAETSSE